MSNTRIRLTRPVVATRAQAEATLGELAAEQAELNAVTAALDAEVTAVRAKYEAQIDTLKKGVETKSGLLQAWAEASPEEFGEKKSLDLLHGRLGFRTGMPQLKTRSGWSFKKVLEVIQKAFVRTKEELDKEGILAAYAQKKISDKELAAVGLRVDQDEAFFVEPKLEQEAA